MMAAMRARGYQAMILASLFFSLMGVAVRHAKGGFDLPQLVFMRGLVCLVILLPWAIKNPALVRGGSRFWLILRALTGTLAVFGNFYALQSIPLATATVLNQTSPLFAVILIWILFAKKPAWINVLGLAGAFIGVIFVFPIHTNDLQNRLGVLAGLGSGVCAAFAYISIRRLRFTDESGVILVWFSTISMVLVLPFCFNNPWPEQPKLWMWAIAAGLGAYLGQSFLIRSLSYLTATAGSTAGLLGAVFATFWGWLLFDEILHWREGLGMVLIVVCGALPAFFEGNRKVQESPSPFRWQKSK